MEKRKILMFLSYLFILIGALVFICSFKPRLIGLPSMFYPEGHYYNQVIIYYPFWYAIPFFLIGVIFYYLNYLKIKIKEVSELDKDQECKLCKSKEIFKHNGKKNEKKLERFAGRLAIPKEDENIGKKAFTKYSPIG